MYNVLTLNKIALESFDTKYDTVTKIHKIANENSDTKIKMQHKYEIKVLLSE